MVSQLHGGKGSDWSGMVQRLLVEDDISGAGNRGVQGGVGVEGQGDTEEPVEEDEGMKLLRKYLAEAEEMQPTLPPSTGPPPKRRAAGAGELSE